MAELAKRTYGPGEGGILKVTFDIGDRMGLQEKRILVTTDDSAAGAVNLILRVKIEEMLTCSTRMLSWPLGTPAKDQVVEIAAPGENHLVSLEIQGMAPKGRCQANVEVVAAGTKYLLRLRPVSVDQLETIEVTALARFAGGAQYSFKVLALVR